jgi:YidC/Oxa1 family membrane protein insertase
MLRNLPKKYTMDKRTILFVILMTVVFYAVNHFFFPSKPTPPPPQQMTASVSAVQDMRDEKKYVIENDYQQVVVSTLGGAIAEINLPFRTEENSLSVVRPIEFDHLLAKEYPQSDYFPLGPYTTSQGTFPQGQVGGYYPLLRRDIAPRYYAMTEGEEATVYSVQRLEKNVIVMEGKTESGRITKTYQLPDDPNAVPYTFEVTVQIQGNGQGLSLGTGVPEVEIVSGSSTQSLKYQMKRNQQKVVEQISLPKEETTINSVHPNWVADSNGFFALILDPVNEMNPGFSATRIPGSDVPTRLSLIDAPDTPYPANKYPGYEMRLPFKKGSGTYQFKVFAGPLAKSVLEKGDYAGAQSFHGWFSFISGPFAKFLFFLMRMFYAVVHSWGFAIILLTIALRLMMYPLNAWSIKSTIKMQKLAPKLSALQEKYKKDPKKAQVEIMGMYREQGVNPLGGCLPLLIQMPFLIGMFDLLKSVFELRGARFIPGWIDNLAAPDILFSWHTPIWFIGTSFHLLPFLLGGTMFWQQKMSATKPRNPQLLTDQQKQQKMMGNVMTVVFTVLFYNFPSGLNIYWLSSMLLGILQQWWMTKKIK